MTIQILQATDNNPPKISFLSIFKPSKAKKNYFYIMLGLVFIYTLFKTMGTGQSFFGKFFWNLGIIWVLNIPVILVWTFFTKVIGVAKMGSTDGFGGNIHDYYKNVFIHNGYQVDFEAKGIVIDTKNRKIGFTTATTGINKKDKTFDSMLVCDFSDVRKWYSQGKNIYGSNGGKVSSIYNIHVEIAYPQGPMQGFDVLNEFDAQQWIARLSSLING